MKIAIFGFGKEGVAAVNYFGKNNDISIIDDRREGEIEENNFKNLNVQNLHFFFNKNLPKSKKFDQVVRSPSVRPDHKTITKLTELGATLTSGTQIFFDKCPAPIIAITGTKGKGTTATLIFEMLKNQNRQVHLAGNIGTPALEILPLVKKEDIVILELSSFQIIDLKKSPHIAVVLMVTSEHLDWHKNQGEYLKSKESIIAYQKSSDFSIINEDFKNSQNLAKKTKSKVYFVSQSKKTNGVFLKGIKIFSQIKGSEEICSVKDIFLPGRHNLQNVMAAVAVAKIYGIENKNIVKVLSSFKGLDHRLQYLGEIKGVKFFNDSYSTIPETTIAAIEAIEGNKVLILGGSSKGSDFTFLAKTIVRDQSVKAIVLVGVEAKRIKGQLKDHGYSRSIIESATNMKEIVAAAAKAAVPKDSVILSPACASFDMFKNYEDRGEQFINEVNKLAY